MTAATPDRLAALIVLIGSAAALGWLALLR